MIEFANERLRKTAVLLLLLLTAVATASLCGWMVGSAHLKAIVPGLTPMNPMTSVGLIGVSGALLLLFKYRTWRKWTALGLSATAGLIAIDRIVATFMGVDRAMDTWLFRASLDLEPRPNRMAFATAWCLLACAASVLAITAGKKYRFLGQLFSLGAAFTGLMVVNCYGFSVLAGQVPGSEVPMALHVAILFVVFCVCIFLATARDGFAAPLMEETFAARLARQLMVSLLLAPPIMGWLASTGLRFGLYGPGMEEALLVTALGAVFAFNVWLGARANNRAEREASRQIEQARLDAERANHAKSEFLSKMSHELRTPLNAILGFSQLIQMGVDQEKTIAYVDLIHGAGKHLLGLINEILEIARIEAGRTTFSCEPVGAAEIVNEAASMATPIAKSRGVNVIVDEASLRSLCIFADRQRLFQIILNLLTNAIKYNCEAGTARIAARKEGDWVIVEVSDTGRGIAPEMESKLFVPFERLGDDTFAAEGTGLGLVLSKALAEGMGGTLTLAETSPAGSRFELKLAVAPATPVELREIAKTLSIPAAARSAVVLAIEDNPANLAFLAEIMELRSHVQLVTATTGLDGLEKACQVRPDLILLDVHLPDISGHEVLARVRENPEIAETPVVILTADATESQRDRFDRSKVSSFLTKPLDVRKFLTTLDEVLGSQSEAA